MTGASGYNIYRSTTSGGEVYLGSVTGGSTTSYIDSGNTSPGTATPPSVSTDTTNSNSVSLTWSSINGANSYIIYESLNSNFTNSSEYTSNSTSLTYTGASGTFVGSVINNVTENNGGNLNVSSNQNIGGSSLVTGNSSVGGTSTISGGSLNLNNTGVNTLTSATNLSIIPNTNNVGTLGFWSTTTSFPQQIHSATSIEYGGYIYEIGGQNSSVLSTVYYSQITSNGVIGSWNSTTSLPEPIDGAVSVAYNGYIYEIGGYTTGGVALTSVYYASISSNGTIGSWNTTTVIPSSMSGIGSGVEYGGYIYIVTSSTYYAQINGNGTIGVWTSTNSPSWGGGISSEYNGYIYEIGGGNTNNVGYAQIESNGSLGVWSGTVSLPDSYLDNAASIAYGGYIYVMGGFNNSPNFTSQVEYSQIESNGSLGSWVSVTSLPQALEQATSIEYGGYIYYLGGANYNATSSSVYTTPITQGDINISDNSTNTTQIVLNGSNGDITSQGSLNLEGGGNSITGSGNLYINAGSGGSQKTTTNSSIASWNSTTILPGSIYNATSVEYNGYVYEMGGVNSYVYYSQIGSNGTLGQWNSTTSLPTSLSGASSVEYGGFIYEIGGC